MLSHLQVVRLMDITMRREKIVHDHEMNLPPSWQLDPMQAIEPGQQGMRIFLDELMVLLEDRAQKFVLRMPNRFDDETIVAREVEEGAGFPRRS